MALHNLDPRPRTRRAGAAVSQATDVSHRIAPGELPCCPLCDNEIQSHEPIALIEAHGAKALAHLFCVEEADNDD